MSAAEWIDGDGRTRLVGELVGGGGGGPPSGPAGGDLAGTYPNPQIANGAVTYADLNANVKPTGTALPADEALRALGTGADNACAGNDSRLSDSRTPSGTAGGDLTGNYPNPTIGAGKVAAAQISSTLKPSGSATPSTESLRALGTTSDTACAGNDSRLNESLDQIAAAHATTADWSNNSHKITSLANGSAAQDAAAFGQIPTALPPNGSAGGNLTGTYPNPTIADVALLTTKGDLLGRGTSAPAARLGVGSDGQVLTADAASTLGIKWAAAPSAAVSSVFGRTGAVVAGNADYLAVASGGLTGATAATRFVGGTASGAPASGTFAVGDMVVDQTGKLWVCTAAGTPGTWASVGGGGTPTFHGASVTRSATQSISNTTETAVNYTVEDYDTDAYHDTVTNNTRMTIPTGLGGYYLISGSHSWASATFTRTFVRLVKNGSTILGTVDQNVSGAQTGFAMSVTAMDKAVATDYYEYHVWQQTGGSLNVDFISSTSLRPIFQIALLGT